MQEISEIPLAGLGVGSMVERMFDMSSCDGMREIREGLSTLREIDRSGWSNGALSAEVLELAGLVERAQAELVRRVGHWHARAAWADDGALSPVSWLTARAPIVRPAAVRLVRTARLVHDHEHTAKALDVGDVTVAHVDTLATVARGRARVVRRARRHTAASGGRAGARRSRHRGASLAGAGRRRPCPARGRRRVRASPPARVADPRGRCDQRLPRPRGDGHGHRRARRDRATRSGGIGPRALRRVRSPSDEPTHWSASAVLRCRSRIAAAGRSRRSTSWSTSTHFSSTRRLRPADRAREIIDAAVRWPKLRWSGSCATRRSVGWS